MPGRTPGSLGLGDRFVDAPGWVTVARRIVIDNHRSRQAWLQEVDPSPLEVIPAEDEIDKALWLMTLSDALDDLTPAHREVLVETYFKGRTVNEAAETLGIPSGTGSRPRGLLRPAVDEAGTGGAGGDGVTRGGHGGFQGCGADGLGMAGPMRGSEVPNEHEAVGAYALGILDDAEATAFEAHLATCAGRGLAQLNELAGMEPMLAALAQVPGAGTPGGRRGTGRPAGPGTGGEAGRRGRRAPRPQEAPTCTWSAPPPR
ncbi:hypothetical protein SFUMM280S_09497 [Streptomyces fumanus]